MATQAPDIAAEVRDLRDALGLTQAELAQLLHASVRTVSRWETGDTQPQGLALRELRRWQRLAAQLQELFRPEALPAWFRRPNDALGNRAPWSVARDDDGAEQLQALVHRVEWGIPA